MVIRILIALSVFILAGLLWLGPASPAPGVTAPETPVQETVDATEPKQWTVADVYHVAALAKYSIHARVLGVERYRYDRCAPIAPVDLALGWGKMSNWEVYGKLGVSQRGRFYVYEWGPEGPPIPKGEIITHSANTHIIPADDTVGSALKHVRIHDTVWMDGDLVEVTGPGGFRWRSSLTREDTGNGACELFRVTRLVVETPARP